VLEKIFVYFGFDFGVFLAFCFYKVTYPAANCLFFCGFCFCLP